MREKRLDKLLPERVAYHMETSGVNWLLFFCWKAGRFQLPALFALINHSVRLLWKSRRQCAKWHSVLRKLKTFLWRRTLHWLLYKNVAVVVLMAARCYTAIACLWCKTSVRRINDMNCWLVLGWMDGLVAVIQRHVPARSIQIFFNHMNTQRKYFW